MPFSGRSKPFLELCVFRCFGETPMPKSVYLALDHFACLEKKCKRIVNRRSNIGLGGFVSVLFSLYILTKIVRFDIPTLPGTMPSQVPRRAPGPAAAAMTPTMWAPPFPGYSAGGPGSTAQAIRFGPRGVFYYLRKSENDPTVDTHILV